MTLLTYSAMEKNQTSATSATLYQSKLTIWGSIWTCTVEKIKQVRPVQLYINPSWQFEEAFENAQWKCDQCNITSIQADIWGSIWKCTVEKNQNSANIATLHQSKLKIWKKHLKTHSREKSNECDQCDFVQTKLAIWGGIWIRIVMKNQRRATCATLHQSKLTISALTRLLHCKTSRLINYLYWCKVMQIFLTLAN